MLALRDNCIVSGQDIIAATSTYNSGSGNWSKPAGYDANDTVLIRVWGGGAGGDNIPVDAGGGGGFNQRSFRYGDVPSTVAYVVGAAGPAATDGGDSYVTATGVDVAATGGKTAAGGYAGGKPGFRYGTSTIYTFDFKPYEGGLGGPTGVSLNDAMAVWGGAAGRIDVGAIAPKSIYGGNGSGNDGGNVSATAPGGGGTFYADSGVGQPGRVQFIVIRGWHSTVMSDPS